MAIFKKFVLPVLIIVAVIAGYMIVRAKNLFGVGEKLP